MALIYHRKQTDKAGDTYTDSTLSQLLLNQFLEHYYCIMTADSLVASPNFLSPFMAH